MALNTVSDYTLFCLFQQALIYYKYKKSRSGSRDSYKRVALELASSSTTSNGSLFPKMAHARLKALPLQSSEHFLSNRCALPRNQAPPKESPQSIKNATLHCEYSSLW